jgi:hypothetical protein
MYSDYAIKPFVTLLTLLCATGLTPARAEIYKYVDENGQVTFTDVARKGVRPNQVYNLPGGPARMGVGGNSNAKKGASFRPADFPRVDPATQRRRDDLRRQVLQEELANERQNLDEAKRQLALGTRTMPGERATDGSYLNRTRKLQDAVEQHESNIGAIQKELGSAR